MPGKSNVFPAVRHGGSWRPAWISMLDHAREDVQELVGMMPCVEALS
jgi:hypothetical protein